MMQLTGGMLAIQQNDKTVIDDVKYILLNEN